MGILEFLGSMKSGYQDAMAPVTAAREGMREKAADFFGDTKTLIDDGDATERTVMDTDAFNKRMKSMAEVSASLAKMPAPPSGAMRPQVKSSPAPVMGAAPNPYAPVNYGTMQYGQQMQGGIGSAPTMEQILMALQGRGL
jgi:hypothetical protein